MAGIFQQRQCQRAREQSSRFRAQIRLQMMHIMVSSPRSDSRPTLLGYPNKAPSQAGSPCFLHAFSGAAAIERRAAAIEQLLQGTYYSNFHELFVTEKLPFNANDVQQLRRKQRPPAYDVIAKDLDDVGKLSTKQPADTADSSMKSAQRKTEENRDQRLQDGA